MIDVSRPSKPRVKAKVPTGTPVGPDSVGGSSPGAVAAGREKIFVSNANQDSVTVLDAATLSPTKTIAMDDMPLAANATRMTIAWPSCPPRTRRTLSATANRS